MNQPTRDNRSQAFERAGQEAQVGVLGEFSLFLRHNKKFWLLPLLVVFMLMGMLIILGGTGAAPFIYTLF